MADAIRTRVQTVPVGTDLSTALSNWLVGRYRGDLLGMADVLILLPNNRAVSALTSAFVRSAETGLVLPRMAAIGDLALDEKLGPLLDPLAFDDAPPLPAVDDMQRLLHLAGCVRRHRSDASATEALHLAKQLVQTLDTLDVEEKSLADVDFDHGNADLAAHWSTAYGSLKSLCRESESWLAAKGLMAPAARRNALLYRLSARLKACPPTTPVIAAGITTAAPAIASLLGQIARLPNGLVLLPHVDLQLDDNDWQALGDLAKPTDQTGDTPRAPHRETHPQYHLKLLLHRMGIDRSEVDLFGKMPPKTAQAVQDIFCLPEQTVAWRNLSRARRTMDNVRLLEAEDSAEEARAISVLIRQSVEEEGKRVALVTPDREIASRVAAQLKRWNIEADDSAGRPLAQEPVGTLFLTVSQMLVGQFAPVILLSVLKHPLVRAGEARLAWLDRVRALDLLLRGPQLLAGIDAIARIIADNIAVKRAEPDLALWWSETETIIRPYADASRRSLRAHLDAVTGLADKLTDGTIWKGAAGRRLAEFVEALGDQELELLSDGQVTAWPDLFETMLADIAIRPAYGRHPRVSIFGLLEARLQSADLLICAGLNEGTWPQLPQPDPWLAPHLRRQLDLPGLDRNIGLSAHDLGSALGAPEVVLTRAKRDRSGPSIASRFLLRIQALFGEGLHDEAVALDLARRLDHPVQAVLPHARPEPLPLAAQRKVAISITQMDMLKADPYAFYARNILKLDALKPVDAEPDPAWKGTLVHKIIEDWTKSGQRDPDSLVAFAEAALTDSSVAPALRLLWQPRIIAGLRWVAAKVAANSADGRQIETFESRAEGEIAGIRVHGRIDRIDRQSDGTLVVVDYKTGSPPAKNKVAAGYALQLGLSGALVEAGAVKGLSGKVAGFEYWSLAKQNGDFGYIASPLAKRPKDGEPDTASFAEFAKAEASAAIGRWITGNAPFKAKLKPDYAVYKDYEQLMRLDEWLGSVSWNEADNGN